MVIFLLLGLLSACGFHLRGVATLPAELQFIQLTTDNLTVSQVSQLNRNLVQAGASLNNDGSSDRVGLTVTIRSLPERTLVDSSGSDTIIIRLSRELSYSLTSATGERLVDHTTIIRQMDLQLDNNDALSIEYERISAIESLDRILMNQLVLQLERF